MFIPDIHAPFHDEKAIGAALEFVKWFKPQTIIFLGDVVDFYAISHFTRNPNRRLQLNVELSEGRKILADFRRISNTSQMFLLKGNHEDRLRKFLWSSAPELSALDELSLESLLSLSTFKIKWIESGSMMYHGLLIKHGNIVRQHAGYSARAEMERNGVSGVSGHTHRLAQTFKRDFGGEYTWIESGCLCKLDGVDYLEGQTANWQSGLAVGFFKKDSGRFSVSPIPIVEGKLLFDMKEFYV